MRACLSVRGQALRPAILIVVKPIGIFTKRLPALPARRKFSLQSRTASYLLADGTLAPNRANSAAAPSFYKSDNGAENFHRVQGLPHSAIRTRVLRQDPQRPSIVYAGTTGGLWKTADGGARWSLVSSPDIIVNDVLIDPRDPNRVVVATDLRGVLVSNDGFAHYASSNRGFSHRVVGAVIVDRKDPNRLYVGVANDKEQGGLFLSDDVGKSWQQSSRGLAGRDILSLQQAENGVLFAGTNHGIFRLTSLSASWLPMKMIWGPVPEGQPQPAEAAASPGASKPEPSKAARGTKRNSAVAKTKVAPEPLIPLATAPRVRSLQIGDKAWFAATEDGLFISVDQGEKWYGQTVDGEHEFSVVNCYDDGTVTLAGLKGAYFSRDGGKTWTTVALPKYVSGVYNLTLTPGSTLWLGDSPGRLAFDRRRAEMAVHVGRASQERGAGGALRRQRTATTGHRPAPPCCFPKQAWRKELAEHTRGGIFDSRRLQLQGPPTGHICLQRAAARANRRRRFRVLISAEARQPVRGIRPASSCWRIHCPSRFTAR